MENLVEWVGVIGWFGCAAGVLGSLMLAMRKDWSGYGWVLFLVANVLWALYGVLTHSRSLVTQQAFFTFTSLVGIWQWLIQPRLAAYRLRVWEQWTGGHV